jgi:predicted dehydrogenase
MAKRHRVGIIGSTGRGNYGHGLDVVWREIPNVDVVAVADDDERGRVAAVGKTGAMTSYADYRQMLERERPEIVAVAPRWLDQHRAMLMACAEQGCHVYLEKPFCRSLEEADDVVRAFEMRHLKLAIAHQTRYSPTLDRARKLIRDGEIGDVLEARARCKEDHRGGGEDFWVLGSHIMDMLRAFFGDPLSCQASVTVGGRPARKSDVRQGNEGIGPLAGDAIWAEYLFAGEIRASVATRRDKAGNPSRFAVQIFGTKGILELATGYMNPGQILRIPPGLPAEVVRGGSRSRRQGSANRNRSSRAGWRREISPPSST